MSDDDFKFKHPFSCKLSGASVSGETSFCIRMLQKIDALCTEREFGGGIIWCHSEKTDFRNVCRYPRTPHMTKAYRITFVVEEVVSNRASSS